MTQHHKKELKKIIIVSPQKSKCKKMKLKNKSIKKKSKNTKYQQN